MLDNPAGPPPPGTPPPPGAVTTPPGLPGANAPPPAQPPEMPANEAGTKYRSPFSDDIWTEAQQVREMFQRARDSRRPLIPVWKRNYRVLTNKAWQDQAEPWMPSPKIPQVWPVSLSAVAWMTDQR